MREFPYSTAMVTGASSGIGEGFARRLAAAGVDVVLVARRAGRLGELAAELESAHGVRAEVLAADLTDEEQLATVQKRLTDPAHPVELLVNNAGSSGSGAFAELPAERELHTAVLNAVVPLRLTRACLPGMIARGAGGVVNVSSLVAVLPKPRSATYAASKAFLSSLGESLAMEVERHGVHVTTVHTGLTRSEFHQAAGVPADTLPKIDWLTPDQVARAGLEAVAAGRPSVVPGLAYRVRLPLMRAMPRSVVRALVRRVHRA
ncbi:SDR family NAD(P)-dependent oxidoreductase [Streptomyces glaucescens]|uniref:Putative short-chain dehydrogenase/reductase SDR n=1 Tax=Streptomyces glaucescens TaxID=1907 RepID=A0A089XEL0_STRGA|nr:SDR family oxidoreductase [Streptomyces glaucescens]AIS01719.1 putative short-chain dehydrogenase/reductase SDR [Streptomyces glaucescens]